MSESILVSATRKINFICNIKQSKIILATFPLYANNYIHFDLVKVKTVNKSFPHNNISIFRIIKVKSLQIIWYQWIHSVVGFYSETSIYLFDISMGSSSYYENVECFLIPYNYNFDTLLEKIIFRTKLFLKYIEIKFWNRYSLSFKA